MIDLIKPKEIIINDKRYIISRFPAVEGREIFAKYTVSALPKLGEYKTNEEMMYKILSYVDYVESDTNRMRLISKSLINNHVEDWETLLKIEMAVMEYNASFFQNGRISTFFADIAQNVKQWTMSTLTDSLGQLFQNDKPPSTN